MSSSFAQPVEVLSVEDSAADSRMIAEIFKRSRIKARLNFVSDGAEALDYLHQKGKFAGATRPGLILLDLNLPKKDGRQVLKELKESASFKHIPILVLTTSDAPTDIMQCYGLHANCYFTKPASLAQFTETIKAIEDCWLRAAELPPPTPPPSYVP